MSMLNIGGENAGDAFYRYKMPRLQCKVSKICCGGRDEVVGGRGAEERTVASLVWSLTDEEENIVLEYSARRLKEEEMG